MKVNLAGYNIEHELVKSLTRGRSAVPTPETISAAYARVSRSSSTVEELRREARRELAAARKSNQTIVFDMGHHSIAEHAVFNFDILDVSRLAVEALEHHRLNAYTERSQRYVTLTSDYVVPEELRESELLDEYHATIRMQNQYYRVLFEKLKDHLRASQPSLGADPVRLENAAKEDARYITSLATQTQLGMTVNARNLELLVRRFAAHQLDEVRQLGEELLRLGESVAPSLLVFCGPTDYEKNTYTRLSEFADGFMIPAFTRRPRNFIAYSASDVTLIDHTPNSDNKLLAALMHTTSSLSFAECVGRVERQTLARKKEILKLACQDLQAYDAALREFEHLYLTFELIISAACYAQLKRHRLATITSQPYNPNNGWQIPMVVAEIKEHKNFKDILGRTEETFDKLAAENPVAAQYVLTNSHQRRVVVTLNARELYHVARLREDRSAQWDIRDIASRMVEQARHVMPLTLTLASGKDGYAQVYQELYGNPPAVVELRLPEPRPLECETPAVTAPAPRRQRRRPAAEGRPPATRGKRTLVKKKTRSPKRKK